jgi:transcriptional regulator with XRE-family HTH domain
MAGGTHLTLEERERLAVLKAEGLSLRAIAARLGRAASTVSRELRRNALPKGGYLPVHAEGCYLERAQRPAILERDAKLGPVRACAPAGRVDAGADRRLAQAGRGARAPRRCRRRRSTPSFTGPGRQARSSGGCCRAGGPDAAGGGLGSRAQP